MFVSHLARIVQSYLSCVCSHSQNEVSDQCSSKQWGVHTVLSTLRLSPFSLLPPPPSRSFLPSSPSLLSISSPSPPLFSCSHSPFPDSLSFLLSFPLPSSLSLPLFPSPLSLTANLQPHFPRTGLYVTADKGPDYSKPLIMDPPTSGQPLYSGWLTCLLS